jgi:U2-associated protein SR140
MTAEIFKKQILSVVEVWEDWIVFPPEFTKELRERLDGDYGSGGTSFDNSKAPSNKVEDVVVGEAPLLSSKFKAKSFQPTAAANHVDKDMMDDIDGEPVGDENKSGETIDEELDGESLDGEPLDGEPLDGQPLDGEPLDDAALDGKSMDGESVDSEQGEGMSTSP